jgi:hypothetical protein
MLVEDRHAEPFAASDGRIDARAPSIGHATITPFG